MSNHPNITRRTVLKSSAAIAGALAAGGCAAASEEPTKPASPAVPKYTKADFYDGNGKFDKDKAFQAYFDLMDRFHYPISPILRTDEFWTSDFAQNDFLNVGMGGIFWINDTEHKYFAHEIYLLPGQMIVEHFHRPVPEGAAKHESWHVRHGMVYSFSKDEPTKDLPVELPESQLKVDGITALHCQALQTGEIARLNVLEAPHFLLAGPEGAIVSEYASPHYGPALAFTNKTVVF